MFRWDSILHEYKIYLSLELSLSSNTIESYLRDVKRLQKDSTESPMQITQAQLTELVYQYAKIGYAPSSQARFISSIKSFFGFLVLNNLRQDNPSVLLESPKLGNKLPVVLSVEEINQIIDAIDLSHEQGERNRAIVETLYGCGLRVSELINLQLSNLYFNEDFIEVTGKGSKVRLVPIAKNTQKYIESYQKNSRTKVKIHPKATDVLFLNRRGRPLSRVMIFTIIKQLVAQTKIQKKVSPHVFRHSYASHLLQRGADLRAIQQMLGHASITTTEMYAHLNQENLRESILLYHPRIQDNE